VEKALYDAVSSSRIRSISPASRSSRWAGCLT
jgi:hypothetical protein